MSIIVASLGHPFASAAQTWAKHALIYANQNLPYCFKLKGIKK